ncbi:hypothetical protein CEXT_541931 [Caerostris extrusa]|uniref:Uncharacterized protein n=1 Tax=Caerostris extrusa TaxID=172846 RepID=A0AAV4MHL5_CAEEX|nr:hypothetical protein CEXT_541931 [Caerostris extrusa]
MLFYCLVNIITSPNIYQNERKKIPFLFLLSQASLRSWKIAKQRSGIFFLLSYFNHRYLFSSLQKVAHHPGEGTAESKREREVSGGKPLRVAFKTQRKGRVFVPPGHQRFGN